MDDVAIYSLFLERLFADVKEDDQFYKVRPLLAHYTSLEVLEKILATEEIWFSNPLFMNDLEEVRFGILEGARSARTSDTIRAALGTEARHKTFTDALDDYINQFEREHLLDTYVFCLSEHAPEDRDGLLSMWRGYGGDGKGAALVFDTSGVDATEGSPLVLARVHYGTLNERLAWFQETTAKFAKMLIDNDVPDEKLFLASAALFERIKLFALFTKHQGFREEREWRVAYMSDRDGDGKLRPMRNYLNGPRGVEPKLKLKLAPVEGVIPPDFTLDKILNRILLGPSASSALAVRSVERMLDVIGKPALKERLFASSIPLRPA